MTKTLKTLALAAALLSVGTVATTSAFASAKKAKDCSKITDVAKKAKCEAKAKKTK